MLSSWQEGKLFLAFCLLPFILWGPERRERGSIFLLHLDLRVIASAVSVSVCVLLTYCQKFHSGPHCLSETDRISISLAVGLYSSMGKSVCVCVCVGVFLRWPSAPVRRSTDCPRETWVITHCSRRICLRRLLWSAHTNSTASVQREGERERERGS